MAQNLQLDPKKRDYILVQGSPVPSDRVLEAAYYALLIPRDKWLYGVDNQGSYLYLFRNSKRTSSTEQIFAARATDAINTQLIQTGQAKAVSVYNLASSRNGTSNEIDIVPNQQQISNQLNFNPV